MIKSYNFSVFSSYVLLIWAWNRVFCLAAFVEMLKCILIFRFYQSFWGQDLSKRLKSWVLFWKKSNDSAVFLVWKQNARKKETNWSGLHHLRYAAKLVFKFYVEGLPTYIGLSKPEMWNYKFTKITIKCWFLLNPADCPPQGLHRCPQQVLGDRQVFC
jgi:hypothetical protein